MDFSSLVLMEKDKETGFLTKELGSFEVGEGALYVRKFYEIDGRVIMTFDTNKDVEDWEYSAVYDYFDYDMFTSKGYDVEDVDDEFNPTWKIETEYKEDSSEMGDMVYELCIIIKEAVTKALEEAQNHKEEYV